MPPPDSGKSLSEAERTLIATWVDQAHGVLYFAAERASANGNAKVGFWFLKNGAAERANGTFAGSHSSGDLLIEADFTTGSDKTRGLAAFNWEGIQGQHGRITERMKLSSAQWNECSPSSTASLCGGFKSLKMSTD